MQVTCVPTCKTSSRVVDQPFSRDASAPDEIVQTRRDTKSANRLLIRLPKKQRLAPKRVITVTAILRDAVYHYTGFATGTVQATEATSPIRLAEAALIDAAGDKGLVGPDFFPQIVS